MINFKMNCVVGVILLYAGVLVSQPSNSLYKDIVPPSADAFAFGRILETEANSFTGAAQTSIPIYTVKNNSLTLPISIDYNGSGVRVADPAGWVGMGWSLNAGGMISRSVQGIPDESTSGRLNFAGNLSVGNIANGLHDAESDVFSYSFAGYSGKFVVENSGTPTSPVLEVLQMPHTDLKIIPKSTDLDEFTIIDPSGNQYFFGASSGSNYEGKNVFAAGGVIPQPFAPDDPESRLTTNTQRVEWYLRKIVSVNGFDELNFTYQDNHYGLLMPGEQEYGSYRIIVGSECTGGGLFSPYVCSTGLSSSSDIRNRGGALYFDTDQDDRFGDLLYYNQIAYQVRVIKTITDGRGTSITFNKSTDQRKDYSHVDFSNEVTKNNFSSNAFPLKEIVISEGEFDQKLTFSYDYFEAQETPEYSFDHRLKLDQVVRTSGTGSENPYVFEYFNKMGTSTFNYLPWRLSKATDHYGFYNGEDDNNDNLYNIESAYITADLNDVSIPMQFGSSIRSSAASATQRIGSLKSITYPTKGKVVYDLESNSIFAPSSNPIDTPLPCNNPGHLCSINTCSFGECCDDLDDLDSQGTTQSENFTMSSLIFNSYMQLQAEVTCSGPEQRVTCDRSGSLQLSLLSGATLVAFEIIPFTGCSYSPSEKLSFASVFPEAEAYIGSGLTFVVNAINSEATINFYERTNPGITTLKGGVRVGSIQMLDIDGSLSKEITYSYDKSENDNDENVNGNGESSGILMVDPLFAHVHYTEGDVGNLGVDYNGLTYRFTSGGTYPISDFNGYHIAYKRVRKSVTGGGYTIYQNSPEIIEQADVEENFPYVPFDYYPENGKVDIVRQYDKNGYMVSKMVYDYQTITHRNGIYNNFRVKPYTAQNGTTVHYMISQYDYTSKFCRDFKIDDIYLFDDGEEVETNTSHSYGATDVTIQPSLTTITNSDGKKHVSSLYYYDSYTGSIPGVDASAVKSELENRNILLPWRTFKSVSNSAGAANLVVDGSVNKFAFYKEVNGKLTIDTDDDITNPVLLYETERLEVDISPTDQINSSVWETQYLIPEYDDSGAPSKVFYDGWDIPQEYEWDESGNMISSTYSDYIKTYKYFDDSDQLESITQIDGNETKFMYDDLKRLKMVNEINKGRKTSYEYHFSTGGTNKNRVKMTTEYTTLGTQAKTLVDYTFFDGFSRDILTKKIRQGSSSDGTVIISKEYDTVGRLFKEYEPRELPNHGVAYINPSGFATEYSYDDSPLNRVTNTTDPSSLSVFFEYGTNTNSLLGYNANELRYELTRDGNSVENVKYYDKIGNLVGVKNGTKDVMTTLTHNVYDRKNRLVEVKPNIDIPIGSILPESYYYTYTGNDLLASKKIPYNEIETYKYNIRDQLTIMRNGALKEIGENVVLLYAYDEYGNQTREGISPTYLDEITDPEIDYEFSGVIGLTQKEYYTAAAADPYTATQDGELGRLAREISVLTEKDGYEYSNVRNYEYDTNGRLITLKDDTWNLSVGVEIPYFFRSSDPNQGSPHYKISSSGKITDLGVEKQQNLGPCDYPSPAVRYSYDSADNIVNKKIEVCFHTLSDTESEIQYGKINHIDFAGRSAGESIDLDLNGTYTRLSELSYTAKGQLNQKSLGELASGTNPIQNITYDYRNNGDLEQIKSTNHNESGSPIMQLDYLYFANRNIAQITQDFKYAPSQDYVSNYNYDGLNRLSSFTTSKSFGSSYTYDDNNLGNIKTIERIGTTANDIIDNLNIMYEDSGNRITTITDSGTNDGYTASTDSYEYDKQGNITYDPSRGVVIYYDYRNLPVEYDFGSGKKIAIQYRLNGSMYKKTTFLNNEVEDTRIYFDDMEFLNGKVDRVHFNDGFLKTNVDCDNVNNSITLTEDEYQRDMIYAGSEINSTSKLKTGTIRYKATDNIRLQGPFRTEGNAFSARLQDPINCANELNSANHQLLPYYKLTDHLGNTRVLFSNFDGAVYLNSDEVVSEYSYYPFGMEMAGFTNSNLEYKHLYNGKELFDDFDLGYYNYENRFYDPAIGRFTSIDKLADHPNQVDKSPYAAMWNNPILYNDPDGNCPKCFKALIKTGIKSIRKGKLDLSEVHDVVESVGTLLDGQLNLADAEAVFNLVSPVSTKELKSLKKFGGKKSTESVTSKEAFRKAKDQNGIPRSQQPDKTIKPGTPDGDAAGLDSRNVRQHEFTNSKGEKVTIRQDKPAKYNDGGKGDQGPHYNAGQSGEKLKQHHNYKENNGGG